MTTARMNKLVTKHYVNKNKTILTPAVNPNLEIDYSGLKHVNGYCNSKYKRFFTVPLLIYTFSKERIQCDINYKLITWPMIDKLNNYLGQEYYQEKLNGKKLVLEWKRLPNTIEHQYVNHFIALPFSYVDIDVTKVHFKSDLGSINCVMKLLDASGHVLKQVNLEESMNPILIESFFEGRRRDFIWNGLRAMDEHYNMAFHQLINSILEQIQQL